MAKTVYVPNPAGEKFAFRSWNGTVGRWMKRQTREAAFRTRQEAPHPGKLGTGRTRINYSTGKLASNIETSYGHYGARRDLESRVIANADYAFFVHEGTNPHPIRAKRAPLLVFYWHRVGRVVAFPKVNHPGTPANPFLFRALRKTFRRI